MPPPCSSAKYDSLVREAVAEHWRDFPEPLWWKAQLCQESQFNPHAVSPVGAQGLAQIMPQTYAEILRALKWDRAASAFDPYRAIHAGAYYQGKSRRGWRANGRMPRERNDLGLCSYNAGAGNCIKAQKLCGDALLWPAVRECLRMVTGEKNAHETKTYVTRIHQWWREMEMH